MKKHSGRAALAALFIGGATLPAWGLQLEVDVNAVSRSRGGDAIDAAARAATARLADLGRESRRMRGQSGPFTMPMRVLLTSGGQRLATRSGGTRSALNAPTLVFETTGERAFPADVQTRLQNWFNLYHPRITQLIGAPQVTTIRVLNYDADIPDRQAVAGGVFIPNGTSGPEIRFPIYQSEATSLVNWIHTLMLAWRGSNVPAFDAYDSGPIRASVLRFFNGFNVGVDVSGVLASTYDYNEFYDTANVTGLGAPRFIAPNLLNSPLPAGGSTGGAYLLRYLMAGTAWSKLIADSPSIVPNFFALLDTTSAPSLSPAQLESFLTSSASATFEGLDRATWIRRQHIFDVRLNPGLKLIPEAFPLDRQPGDFGPFVVVLHAFRTDLLGNESLLAGNVFPFYARTGADRIFLTAQDDQMPLTGGYGSVTPDFPTLSAANQAYRVTVDMPFQGQNVRVYLPAGGPHPTSLQNTSEAYGTLVGFPAPVANDFYIVRLTAGATSINIPVVNNAFASAPFTTASTAQSIRLDVALNSDPLNPILTRTVSRLIPGPVGITLRHPSCEVNYVLGRPARLTMLGMPVTPFRPNIADTLLLADSETLAGRWDPVAGRYQFYPVEGSFFAGMGAFVRAPSASGLIVPGTIDRLTPATVALRPGWNMITVPSDVAAGTADVLVGTAAQSLAPFAAAASIVSPVMFRFNPDPLNPDLGTYVETAVFPPGEGVFVRAVASDGGFLSFANGGRSRTSTRAATVGIPPIVGGGRHDWMGNLTLSTPLGHWAQAQLGQASRARDAYIEGEDVSLPVSPGGFQVVGVGGPAGSAGRYRDLRSGAPGQTWSFDLTGLRPGSATVLRFDSLAGSPRLTVRGLGRDQSLAAGRALTFIPTASTMRISVVAR